VARLMAISKEPNDNATIRGSVDNPMTGGNSSPSPLEERPYSAFTKAEKWTIVVLVSLASFFRCA
jgi:hypothetical protein